MNALVILPETLLLEKHPKKNNPEGEIKVYSQGTDVNLKNSPFIVSGATHRVTVEPTGANRLLRTAKPAIAAEAYYLQPDGTISSDPLNAVKEIGEGTVYGQYLLGTDAPGIVGGSPDGIFSGGEYNNIDQLLVDKVSGNLYAIGRFTKIGQKNIAGFAEYDGVEWKEIPWGNTGGRRILHPQGGICIGDSWWNGETWIYPEHKMDDILGVSPEGTVYGYMFNFSDKGIIFAREGFTGQPVMFKELALGVPPTIYNYGMVFLEGGVPLHYMNKTARVKRGALFFPLPSLPAVCEVMYFTSTGKLFMVPRDRSIPPYLWDGAAWKRMAIPAGWKGSTQYINSWVCNSTGDLFIKVNHTYSDPYWGSLSEKVILKTDGNEWKIFADVWDSNLPIVGGNYKGQFFKIGDDRIMEFFLEWQDA